VSQISFHRTQPYVAVQSHDRFVEVFRIRTEEEVRRKKARKKKLEEKKDKDKTKEKTNEAPISENITATDIKEIQLMDLFVPHVVVRAGGKVRSFNFGLDNASSKGGLQVRHRSSTQFLQFKNQKSYS
jgi:U3 small nucleolar RNA-associated protein 12